MTASLDIFRHLLCPPFLDEDIRHVEAVVSLHVGQLRGWRADWWSLIVLLLGFAFHIDGHSVCQVSGGFAGPPEWRDDQGRLQNAPSSHNPIPLVR
jgi:hypothetical protein